MCEFRADDWKRPPISQEYVAALEGRIAALEALLSNIKSSSGHQRDSIVEGIDFIDHLPAKVLKDSVDDNPRGVWGQADEGTSFFLVAVVVGC